MKQLDQKELSELCNKNVIDKYNKIIEILKANDLDVNDVMDTLLDYSRGEDYAQDTIENISKRLIIISKMDYSKTRYERMDDEWTTFGTIHSAKQRYDLKKIDGHWYAKIEIKLLAGIGEILAIKVTDEASKALDTRLTQ